MVIKIEDVDGDTHFVNLNNVLFMKKSGDNLRIVFDRYTFDVMECYQEYCIDEFKRLNDQT